MHFKILELSMFEFVPVNLHTVNFTLTINLHKSGLVAIANPSTSQIGFEALLQVSIFFQTLERFL